MDVLRTVAEAGADAVYLGGKTFSICGCCARNLIFLMKNWLKLKL
jgi:collagenase-like PrtC family protease